MALSMKEKEEEEEEEEKVMRKQPPPKNKKKKQTRRRVTFSENSVLDNTTINKTLDGVVNKPRKANRSSLVRMIPPHLSLTHVGVYRDTFSLHDDTMSKKKTVKTKGDNDKTRKKKKEKTATKTKQINHTSWLSKISERKEEEEEEEEEDEGTNDGGGSSGSIESEEKKKKRTLPVTKNNYFEKKNEDDDDDDDDEEEDEDDETENETEKKVEKIMELQDARIQAVETLRLVQQPTQLGVRGCIILEPRLLVHMTHYRPHLENSEIVADVQAGRQRIGYSSDHHHHHHHHQHQHRRHYLTFRPHLDLLFRTLFDTLGCHVGVWSLDRPEQIKAIFGRYACRLFFHHTRDYQLRYKNLESVWHTHKNVPPEQTVLIDSQPSVHTQNAFTVQEWYGDKRDTQLAEVSDALLVWAKRNIGFYDTTKREEESPGSCVVM